MSDVVAPQPKDPLGTLGTHYRAVERAIRLMRQQLEHELPLERLAHEGRMSPFHFNRVFRKVTGVPPCRFLWALRLERAKQLLASTDERVTDVCFSVGYNSLGTFTRRFSQLVGVAPLEYRRLSARPCSDAATPVRTPNGAGGVAVDGRVRGGCSNVRHVYVGLFTSRIPQGQPVACRRIDGVGDYTLEGVLPGMYHLMAAAFDDGRASSGAVGSPTAHGHALVDVSDGVGRRRFDVWLQEPTATDPPLLLAVPYLGHNGALGHAGGGPP